MEFQQKRQILDGFAEISFQLVDQLLELQKQLETVPTISSEDQDTIANKQRLIKATLFQMERRLEEIL